MTGKMHKIAGPLRMTAMLGVLLGASLAAMHLAQAAPAPAQEKDSGGGGVELLPVQGNVYMLAGDGGNITLQVGNDGVLIVDTGLGPMTDKVVAAIHSLSDKPIRYIINTSDDVDHVGGNETIAKLGKTIAGGNVVGNIGESAGNQATVIAFQTVLDRMSAPTGQVAPYPEGAWPTDTFTTSKKNLWFNDEGIRIVHQPAAHTDSDSMVIFRRSDVVSTGDVFRSDSYPVIDLKKGGSIQGTLDGLNRLVYDITLSAAVQGGPTNEGGTMVIPGHGRICDQADVVYYQEMVTIIRDRIQDMIKKEMTLEQVQAAKPTQDYDPLYGKTSGPWTTEMFVEAVYKSLASKKDETHGKP